MSSDVELKSVGLLSRIRRSFSAPESGSGGEPESSSAVSDGHEWMAKAAQVCEQAASGNLEARLTYCKETGDTGRLVHSIDHLLDMTDAFLREARASLEHASQGKFYRRVILRGMLGAFRSASETINQDIETMARDAGLKESVERRRELADRFESTVKSVFSALATSASRVNVAVQTLAVAAGDSAKSMPNAELPAKSSPSAAQKHQLNQVIARLTEASHRIGGIVKLISEIAGQTNLLALNATIEAARAGQAGRGFAVVASEVKELSKQTAGATEEITHEISKMRATVEDTATLVSQMSQSITEMKEISSQLSDQTGELSASVDSFLQTIRA